MLKRWIAGVLAAFNGANGVLMLADGPGWYARVPGVTETGPFNPHFVADIGMAFLATALGLAARAWRPALWPAAMAGASFLALHALIHVAGWTQGHTHTFVADAGLILIPAALALWAATPSKGGA